MLVLTLNRPERLNAWTDALEERYYDRLDAAGDDLRHGAAGHDVEAALRNTTAFARRGLVAEYGISWLLPRLVGHSTALDLLLSGRVVLGEEALPLRLVDRLSEPGRVVEDAVAYASELVTSSSPWSMATIKAQVKADLDRSFTVAVAEAEELMIGSFDRPDVLEGVVSYHERRRPAFPSLEPRSLTR